VRKLIHFERRERRKLGTARTLEQRKGGLPLLFPPLRLTFTGPARKREKGRQDKSGEKEDDL